MAEEVTFKISDNDKKHFEDQVSKITPEDEAEVKTKFGKKLEGLEKKVRKSSYTPDFLASLIGDVKFLYEMLCDKDYTVNWQTKAWIIFALAYFISPVDAIPDVIPVFGYMDDAVVVAWVCHKLRGEIADYKAFLKG